MGARYYGEGAALGECVRWLLEVKSLVMAAVCSSLFPPPFFDVGFLPAGCSVRVCYSNLWGPLLVGFGWISEFTLSGARACPILPQTRGARGSWDTASPMHGLVPRVRGMTNTPPMICTPTLLIYPGS